MDIQTPDAQGRALGPDDKALVDRIQAGDVEAMRGLYRRYQPGLGQFLRQVRRRVHGCAVLDSSDQVQAEIALFQIGHLGWDPNELAFASQSPTTRKQVIIMAPGPPFTRESAIAKVRLAEDGWNSRDPQRVSLAYGVGSRWRNRTEFPVGRDEIVAFLIRKWAKELDYRLAMLLVALVGVVAIVMKSGVRI